MAEVDVEVRFVEVEEAMVDVGVEVRFFEVEETMVDVEVGDCESTDGFVLDVHLTVE